eukprot:UN06029
MNLTKEDEDTTEDTKMDENESDIEMADENSPMFKPDSRLIGGLVDGSLITILAFKNDYYR